VKSRSNATGLIKPKIWQTSKIVILRFFSMCIFDLPVFFQSKKRCRLETVPFLTSASPLPPSNALLNFLWIRFGLLFGLFFFVNNWESVCIGSIKKAEIKSAEGLKRQTIISKILKNVFFSKNSLYYWS